MVDRTSRDRLSELMRSYMDDQIDNIQLDETLHEIGSQTEDQTVRTAVRELWFYYDDCKEHFVVASKEQWDFFNRLLLLLASDAEIAVAACRRWHPSQSIAAVSLILFICLAILKGWGRDLIGLAFPFGMVSMVLVWFNRRRRKRAIAADGAAVSPFPSFSVLRSVRRRVGGFAKIRYPREIAGRKVRGRIEQALPWIIWIPVWLIFSPVFLFFQMLPEKQSDTAVMLPGVG